MALFANVQRLLLYTGFAAAAVLLLRFAVDFGAEMNLFLALPFWLLVVAALAVYLLNLIKRPKEEESHLQAKAVRALLLASIPLAFIASSLDCTGLSLAGCSGFCTFVKMIWIPLLALGCAACFLTNRKWLLLVITIMSFAPLAPHCVCYNAGNAWWIDHAGASPTCYAWGFTVSMISISGMYNRAGQWASLAVGYAIIAGATSFFITHHYLHFPW